MSRHTPAVAVRLLASAAAVVLLSVSPFGADRGLSWRFDTASADDKAAVEKDAFEAAKELGTVEAWDAFLANYPSGFHADLARAYVKKLAEPDAPAAAVPAAAPAAIVEDYPTPAGSWGGVVRSGPGQQYRKVESLDEGEAITLMGKSEVFENGYPWFKIAYRDGEIGYKWGGILCSTGAERPDLFKTCTVRAPVQANTGGYKKKPVKSEGCGKGRISIDGRCIRKRDAATHCGPGYRLKGNTCVQGYQAPDPNAGLPSWQIEAIQKGCPKGMGWNAAEGCHEND